MVKIDKADTSAFSHCASHSGCWWACPKCDYQEIMSTADYCAGCGEKIEWIEEEE